MSPTPPSTSSSTGVHSPEGQYRVVRRRNRVPLSCAPCRSRKLKCNRAVPCENCIKRGDAQSCTYAERKNRRKNAPAQNSPTTPDDMQNRIDRLEGLVLSLMTNGSQSGGPAAAAAAISATGSSGSGRNSREDVGDEDMDVNEDESDTEQVTKSFGILKMDNQKSYYISDAHWSAVLSDIAEVKQYFATHKKQYEEQAEKIEAGNKDQNATAPSLIFGAMKKPNEAEIMSTFPSKYTTDILMARYFNTYDPSTHVLHGPTFWREYARHWEDPSKTSIVWIGMIFAMMRLAMLSYHRDGDEPPEFRGKSLDMAATYRNSMSQCLVLADYTKPHRYLMETLILHLHGDYTQSADTEVSVWVLIGMITRLAMRMGYHREPKLFPNITPFQSEMRRRMWTFIRQADILFSFQVGLPCMIRAVDTDTCLPRNIHDEDFDENSTELPPERSPNEPTPISYIIGKARLAFAFGRVMEYTQHVKGSSYDQIMEIDSELREAHELIPERLRVRPIAEIENEPAAFIMARFSVASIYYKAQCVLHRRFLTRGRQNARYVHSRRCCIDSALELLKFQSMLHAETRPHGRLQHRKWYLSSLSMHDFLMAGTIIALDLHQGMQLSNSGGQTLGDAYVWGVDRRQEMLNALRHSRDIWSELKDQRMEAWKATIVLDLLLEQVTRPVNKDVPPPGPTFDSQDEKQNAAMTLGLLSSGLSPGGPTSPPQFPDLMSKFDSSVQQGMMDQDTGATPPPFGMFNQMPDMQAFNLDWDAWDNYLQTATVDPANPAWPSFDFNQIQQPNPIGGVSSSTTGPGAETYTAPQPFFDPTGTSGGPSAASMYMNAPNDPNSNLPPDHKRI